jgi:hypothetical protein
MILRASDALRRTVYKVPEESAIIPIPGSHPEKVVDLSNLIPIMPEWMNQLLLDGNLIIIDRQEYYDLPYEIREHLEVLTP